LVIKLAEWAMGHADEINANRSAHR
jgi:hypothetical protein